MPGAELHLLYFAWLRERLGLAEERIALPEGVRTVGDLFAWQASRGPAYAAFAGSTRLRCAVNQEFSGPQAAIHPGDEVAFFPPVTGG